MRLYEPVKLSDYCEITSSKRIYAKEYVDSGVPFYRGKEVVASFSGGNVSDPLFISENRFEEIKHRFGAPEKGDLLLTSVGTIGVPYRVSGEFDFYFKDGNLTWFRKLNGVDQNFLYYWLQSPQGKAELSKCTIGAAQPAYTIERLKEISIELPPENIQRDIASVIADYDLALKNNRRRIQLLEESARLLYQEWFVHLRFPGHEQVKITDGVPEGWSIKRVDSLLGKVAKKKKIKKEEYLEDGVVPCVDQSQEFIGGYIDDEEAAITENLPVVVFGDHTRIVKFIDFPFAPGADGTQLLVPNDEEIPRDFFYFMISSINVANAFYARHFKFLKAKDVLVPEKKLMHEFSLVVKDNMLQIKLLRNQNRSLAKARDLLLPKLMSGELTV